MCKNQVRWPQGTMLHRHIKQFLYSECPVSQRVWRGRWSHMTHDLSVFNTVFKRAADSGIPPICSASAQQWKQNIGITGSFWQRDSSWLHIVCSEVTLLSGFFFFFWLAATLAFHLAKTHNVQSIQEVNPGTGSSSNKNRANLHPPLHAD